MKLQKEFIEDFELLNLFELDSSQAGLKLHHNAAQERLAAAKRLFDKKIITQTDGGYLTALGTQAAEHAQALMTILQLDQE